MILVSHGAFKDKHTGLDCKASELVLHPERADWFVTRLRGAGGTDIVQRQLTDSEYRARVLQTFPQLAKR